MNHISPFVRECIGFPELPQQNIPQTRRFKRGEILLTQLWRLEVQNQGAGRVGAFGRLPGRICSVALS